MWNYIQDCHVNSCIQQEEKSFTRIWNWNLRKKLVKWYIWSIVLFGTENWILLEVDQKYHEGFEMSYWRRMEISCTDRMKNEEVLHRIKDERNTLYKNKIKRREGNWIGHILRRNCLLQHVLKER
jgi:hypothetical protein